MTRKEYEQRLEALELEIAALRQEGVEEGAEKPPHPKPKLKPGDIYYYLDSGGNVMKTLREKMTSDCNRFDFGNMFLTDEAAKYAAEYHKVLAEMWEWAGEWNDPWRIVYTPPFIVPMAAALKSCSAGELRFATQEDANNCIKAVGEDRLIKYYFGVRDHEIPAENE